MLLKLCTKGMFQRSYVFRMYLIRTAAR